MGSETVAGTSFLNCTVCHGWWLPHGSLTHLNKTYHGAAARISIDEQELFARAMARTSAFPHTLPPLARSGKHNPDNLWFWSVFFGLLLVLAGLIFFAGLQKTLHTTRWNQPPDGFLLFLIMGMVGGLWLIWHGWTVLQRKRLMVSIPTSSIRSLALGLVEINGCAEPEAELLTSPFSGIPCLFYSYTVEERVSSSKNTHWRTIARGTSDRPFFVRDATGRVLVVPLGADLILPNERVSRTSWLGELPPRAADSLRRLGISIKSWRGRKTLRGRESFILPDESVYVLGTAQEHQGRNHHSVNESRLYIGNSRDHAFLISDRSENDLLSRLTWQMWTGFIGGTALVATCAAIMCDRYLTTIRP
jgi:hypothetical protein